MTNMRYFKYILIIISFLLLPKAVKAANDAATPVSTKKERNHISKGNKFYEEGKYKEALQQYKEALEKNPESVIGKYNLGLAEIRIGSNPNDTTETAKKILEAGVKDMEQVANLGARRPELASKANYNLGNVAFNQEDFRKAVDYYKRCLRLNPDDEKARKNLRIAQLKIKDEDQSEDKQDQNEDQNEDQNQDQEEQQDQNQDNQDQNEEQNQDQNEDQQDQQQQQSDLNEQTAEQILNAIENKENQTRARVAGQDAEKSRDRNRNKRNW